MLTLEQQRSFYFVIEFLVGFRVISRRDLNNRKRKLGGNLPNQRLRYHLIKFAA